MAYSRTPEFNTHQLKHIPVSGSSYPNGSLDPAIGMRYLNCAPRTFPRLGMEPERLLIKRPTYTKQNSTFSVVEPYRFRGIGHAHGKTYFAADGKVFSEDGAFVVTLNTADQYFMPVFFEEANVAGVPYLVVLEERAAATSYLHIRNLNTSTNTSIDLGFISTGRPVFINGYLFIAENGTQRIYNSEVGSLTTWTLANNFIDAEMFGDTIITLHKHRNHLLAFGSRSIEFFYDGAIEIGSPLVRQESYATSVGIVSDHVLGDGRLASDVIIGNDIYFLGTISGTNSYEGGLGLYRVSNFKVERVASPDFEFLYNSARTYSPTNPSVYLFHLDYFGEPVIVASLQYYSESITLSRKYFGYHTKENVWTELSFPANEVSGVSVSYLLGGSSGSFLVSYDGDGEIVGLNISKETSSPVTAEWTTDFFDGGNNSMKHFKYVDVLGSIGTVGASNTVTLSYSKEYMPVTFTSAVTATRVDDQFHINRFRNLGRARRITFKATFTGTAPIAVSGLDVAYNNGVY